MTSPLLGLGADLRLSMPLLRSGLTLADLLNDGIETMARLELAARLSGHSLSSYAFRYTRSARSVPAKAGGMLSQSSADFPCLREVPSTC